MHNLATIFIIVRCWFIVTVTATNDLPVQTSTNGPPFLPTSLYTTEEDSTATTSHQVTFIPTIPQLTGVPVSTPVGFTTASSTDSAKSTAAERHSILIDPDILRAIKSGSDNISMSDEGKKKNDSTGQKKKVAPYGSWSSPISSAVVFTHQNEITEPPKVDRVTGHVYWAEELTEEDGHGAVFQYNIDTKQINRWTKPGVDVRNRVHEYGGGSFLVHNNSLFYSDGNDGNIYRQQGTDGNTVRITNSTDKRYADGNFSPVTNKLYYVCEDHTLVKSGASEYPKNSIIQIDLSNDNEERELITHAEFFAAPKISQDGKKIIWVQWNHPHMPWDKTEVYTGTINRNDSTISYEKYLQNYSMMMPSWNQHNELLYVHEMTSWWNLYIINRNGVEINLTPKNIEVGWPTWQLGTQAYDSSPAIGSHDVIVIAGNKLNIINSQTEASLVLDTEYTTFTKGIVYSNDGKKAYTIAASQKKLPRVVEIDLSTGVSQSLTGEELHTAPKYGDYFSVSEQIQFPTTEQMFAYGHYYAPHNPEYEAPSGTAPPLIVRTHQGPTLAASTTLNLAYQFFTSRGFAILDVDHRGSTGYGRYYRNLLIHKWGVYDRADLVAGTEKLVREKLAHPNLLFADGESAGGFSALGAVTFTDIFKAGASFFGVTNLTLLTVSTHKFESQYINTLVGDPLSQQALYEERSPIHNSENMSTPVIFLHGTADAVVPVEQAKSFHSIIKSKGIPTALVLFEGEYHGFAKLENKMAALESEIIFFSTVGNFTLPDVTKEIFIDNMTE